ncbi:hypothetical protein MBT84_06005 [Streptomyces sp. MBT84]|nr:hypothetical protein [Streptomyces sp. MBT84]
MIGGRVVFRYTRRALYAWEWQAYPQFSIPVENLVDGLLYDDKHTGQSVPALRTAIPRRPGRRFARARRGSGGARRALCDNVCFEREALDSWFEEDEPIFVYPRSSYSRVDALRSGSSPRRAGRCHAGGDPRLREAVRDRPADPLLPRSHDRRLDPVAALGHGVPMPVQRTTSSYWSFHSDAASHKDVAWTRLPDHPANSIAGLTALYNEHVDLYVVRRRLSTADVSRSHPGGL